MNQLPTWYRTALRRRARKRLEALSRVQSLVLPIRDSPATAPGWREVAVEYTCVPDACYPWDPEVLKAIQTFCPDVAPLWVRWVFLSPRSDAGEQLVIFGRHGIGRRVSNPRAALYPLHCPMPELPCKGLRFSQPNVV